MSNKAVSKSSNQAGSFDDQDGFYFIPLGGSEQFGVNLNTYICDGKILIVDCGLGFADENYPGIDLLLPDPAWLSDRKSRIEGLVITHAHEDHIGAMPYLYDRLECPIYCSNFTAAILRHKFKDVGIRGADIRVIDMPGNTQTESFNLGFLPVSHSIPEAFSLTVETKYGKVLHSGDWNLDPSPIVGYVTQADDFRALGKQNLLAYIGDSTNSEVDGRAGSEEKVAEGLAKEFKECNGRIVVTIFSSNIGRIVSIAKAAKEAGRQVCVVGRSLHRMVGAAYECGHMDGVDEFLSEDDIGYIPNDKVVIIATGSQGEHRAALGKISRGDHRNIKLNRGDTVIFSSRAIPGNEKNINNVKNNLAGAGIRIVTPRDSEHCIHISGHPCRDEIAEMLRWTKPACVIPVHGELTQLRAHANFADGCQVKHTVIPSNGSVIRLDDGAAHIIDSVHTGLLAVDQKRIVQSNHASIHQRKKLQYTGAVHVSLVIDDRGELLADPQLDMIGLVDLKNAGEEQIDNNLYDEICDLVGGMKKGDLKNDDTISDKVGIGVRRFCNMTLGIKPKTTVHVIRV